MKYINSLITKLFKNLYTKSITKHYYKYKEKFAINRDHSNKSRETSAVIYIHAVILVDNLIPNSVH